MEGWVFGWVLEGRGGCSVSEDSNMVSSVSFVGALLLALRSSIIGDMAESSSIATKPTTDPSKIREKLSGSCAAPRIMMAKKSCAGPAYRMTNGGISLMGDGFHRG